MNRNTTVKARGGKLSVDINLALSDVLSERECYILNALINRASDEDLAEIGQEFNVTGERVRLILAKIQRKMIGEDDEQ